MPVRKPAARRMPPAGRPTAAGYNSRNGQEDADQTADQQGARADPGEPHGESLTALCIGDFAGGDLVEATLLGLSFSSARSRANRRNSNSFTWASWRSARSRLCISI